MSAFGVAPEDDDRGALLSGGHTGGPCPQYVPRFDAGAFRDTSGRPRVAHDTTAEEFDQGDVTSPRTVPSKSLGVMMLFAVLFANCFGSGYGFEDAVRAAGPLYVLIVGSLMPIFWCLPTGLAASELATTIKSNAGILMWVNVAFGSTLSFFTVLSTMFIAFLGNATYPNLCADYLANLVSYFGGEMTSAARIGVKLTLLIISCFLNAIGVELVGGASVAISAISAAPFILITLGQVFSGWWRHFPGSANGLNGAAIAYVRPDVDWATFLTIVSWNYSNLENAGSVAEEVVNPRRTMQKAFVPLVLSTYVVYMFPVIAGVSVFPGGADQDWSKWHTGYWGTVAGDIGGPWLRVLMIFGGVVSAFGYTLTGICCTSRQVAGIGQLEAFPHVVSSFLRKYHPKTKTPVNSILLNTVVSGVLALAVSFEQLVALVQIVYCVRLSLVYLAVLRLRIKFPELPRPYAIPLGTNATLAFFCVAFGFSFTVAACAATQNDFTRFGTLVFIVGGLTVSYFYGRFVKPAGFRGSIVLLPTTGAPASIRSEDGSAPAHSGADSASATPSPKPLGVVADQSP